MKRILIDSNAEVVRTAYINDGVLTEIFHDYKTNGSLVGTIINGVVKNILPSRFAFIDIGQEKNAFMNLAADSTIKIGDYVCVQVRNDATGDKGANVSEILQYSGKYSIIYKSAARSVGISQKISEKAERSRLKKLALGLLPKGYSVILRTQSGGAKEEDLAKEFEALCLTSDSVSEAAKYSTAPNVLYSYRPPYADLITEDIDEVVVNDKIILEDVKKYANDTKITPWEAEEGLFDYFGIERQISKALNRNIWLPCGGFVTFDQVEACVVIDVNTGKFAGKKNYKETALKTNLEAAACVASQIRLRNLSGMIIVDFIDMPDEEHNKELLRDFAKALKKDRIPSDIIGMTSLGLVQLTRRKQRESLSKLLLKPCDNCGGTGYIRK